MTNRTRIFAALSLLAALSGCGSQDPREVLVGTWGADLTIVEQEGAKLSEPMAARMHKLKLDAMRGMRMTIGGDEARRGQSGKGADLPDGPQTRPGKSSTGQRQSRSDKLARLGASHSPPPH